MSESPKPVDQLRQRLRELGYLDARIDRFVLEPVGRGRPMAGVAFRASLRIGLIGALLLGPSTAIGLGARMPGLIVGPRDGLVLAVYFGAVFLLALTVVAFLAIGGAGLFVGRGARAAASAIRARVLAHGAGLLVGLGSLTYLVYWWRGTRQNPQAWHQPGWTVIVLLGVAGLSALLGHSVSTAARAVMAQDLDPSGPVLGRRSRSRMAAALVWALAFAGAAGLFQLSATEGADRTPSAVPRLDLRATGISVLVLGVDGFDLDFAERLVRAGRLPALGVLLGGARAVAAADEDADPATVWTSIATGQPVAVHGVQGLEARRVSGLAGEVPAGHEWWAVLAVATDRLRLTRPAASSGLQRRAKTIWEVAGEQGLRTGVVNWWATWPALEHAGIVISDRATLRLDRGGALDAEIAPPALWDELRAAWPGVRETARRRAADAFHDVAEPAGAALRRGAEQDLIQLALATRIARRAGDLLAVYLPGLDIAQYALVSGPSAAGLPASALEARVEALERYYLVLDGLLGEFLAADASWRLRVLLTDPGRSRTRGQSVLALTGDVARPGADAQATGPDIAPTLLHVLGLPVSQELGGRVLEDVLSPAFVATHPVRTAPTFGRRLLPPARPDAVPLDDAALERLRSLGYIR